MPFVPMSRRIFLFLVLTGGLEPVLSDSSPVTCEPDTCPPTATCVNMDSYIYCECPQGKTGTNCSMDDPCVPQTESCPPGKSCYGPCDPNVICQGATGEPHCRGCVVGWTGLTCDEDINECVDVPDICANGGSCTNLVGDFRCKCTSGWFGKECRCKEGSPCEDEVDQIFEQTTPASGQQTMYQVHHFSVIFVFISFLFVT